VVSRTGQLDKPVARQSEGDARSQRHIRYQEGHRSVQTAGRWPRKSAPAKERVTTHLPNRPVPKTDVAQSPAVRRAVPQQPPPLCGACNGCVSAAWKDRPVAVWSRPGSADLNDSSEYSDGGHRQPCVVQKADVAEGFRASTAHVRGLAVPKLSAAVAERKGNGFVAPCRRLLTRLRCCRRAVRLGNRSPRAAPPLCVPSSRRCLCAFGRPPLLLHGPSQTPVEVAQCPWKLRVAPNHAGTSTRAGRRVTVRFRCGL